MRTLLFALTLKAVAVVNAQSPLDGIWLGVRGSSDSIPAVTSVQFLNRSMLVKESYFRFPEIRPREIALEAVIHSNARYALLFKHPSDTTKFFALLLVNVIPERSLTISVSTKGGNTMTKEDWQVVLEQDTISSVGNLLLHENYLKSFKRSAEEMSLEDFRMFFRRVIEIRGARAADELLLESTFWDLTITQALMESGYSPLTVNQWLDRFIEKYLSDPEVAELFRRL